MSLSIALSNALSGLGAVSRGTEVVSSNLANALTPSYGARELQLSSRTLGGNGGGVRVEGIARLVPAAILADHRIAESSLGSSATLNSFQVTMETAVGSMNQDDSLTTILANFQSALTSATASPDSDAKLRNVSESALGLSNKINYIAIELQKARTMADKSIENDVGRLNSALSEVARLNRLVTIAQAKGQDASALIDARQATIDGIADIVPIKEVQRDNGMVSLFTKGGATLIDGLKPAKIEFSAAGTVTPQMSATNGQLSTLVVDGIALSQAQMNMFKGGSIAASFNIRDNLAPAYQDQLDTFAKDLYDRLSDPTVDSSLGPNEAGFFTDRQGSFDPSSTLGFANRIAVNNAILPENGGELWRIRDGINASVPGPPGDSSTLISIADALSLQKTSTATGTSGALKSIFTTGSDFQSLIASNRVKSDVSVAHDTSYASAMKSSLLAHGVDSDKEMEMLLQLERAYAANAKIIQAVNEMLDNILRIS